MSEGDRFHAHPRDANSSLEKAPLWMSQYSGLKYILVFSPAGGSHFKAEFRQLGVGRARTQKIKSKAHLHDSYDWQPATTWPCHKVLSSVNWLHVHGTLKWVEAYQEKSQVFHLVDTLSHGPPDIISPKVTANSICRPVWMKGIGGKKLFYKESSLIRFLVDE